MIETARLVLRPPRPGDEAPIGAMNTDPEVNHWLGGPISRQDSDDFLRRAAERIAERGYGFYVAERRADRTVIGMIGLVPAAPESVLRGRVELGWRLARSAWGHGYAAEGALACMALGFERLALPEVVSFTASTNLRSQAVMRRIGLQRREDLDHEHHRLPEGHPLRPHVVYGLARETWRPRTPQ